MRTLSKLAVTLVAAVSILLLLPSCANAGRAVGPGPPDARPLPHASPAYMAWALSWRRADVRWRRADAPLRAGFGLHALGAVAKPPRILAFPSAWRTAALRWRAEACARLAESKRLWSRLTRPPRPYTAASWWPLAHYLGWPAWARTVWLKVVKGESHGQPGAMHDPSNPRSATGLMQICPGAHYLLNVVANIKAGLVKFIAAGYRWSPWAATAY